MNQITGMLANKRTIGSIILLGGVLYFTYNLQENSQKLKKATTLESGIQTCFSRVNQTYTAKLLNDQNSQYLTQNFQSLTEECFAEGILNVEENLKTDLPIVAKKLSTLASNVHWFHEDSLLPANSVRTLATTEESRNIGSRFETIENTKDEVIESAETFKASLSNQLTRDKNFFYGTAMLLGLILIWEYISNANRRISNTARENEATDELLDRNGIESVKIGEIIRLALEQNDLIQCAKLFHNFYTHKTVSYSLKGQAKEALVLENLITPPRIFVTPSEAIKNEKQIDDIWNNDGVGVELDKPKIKELEFNLNKLAAKTIDLLSEKISSNKVTLKVEINEDISIQGKTEELDQIFYHLISNAISANNNSEVHLQGQRLGDIVIFDVAVKGVGSNGVLSAVDMKICQILLDEIKAKIKVDNTLDQLGNVTGARLKVIFQAGIHKSKTSKLVDLKIGSKQAIAKAMREAL